jgi:hypothetical protein
MRWDWSPNPERRKISGVRVIKKNIGRGWGRCKPQGLGGTLETLKITGFMFSVLVRKF